jgi:hypothetical protein
MSQQTAANIVLQQAWTSFINDVFVAGNDILINALPNLFQSANDIIRQKYQTCENVFNDISNNCFSIHNKQIVSNAVNTTVTDIGSNFLHQFLYDLHYLAISPKGESICEDCPFYFKTVVVFRWSKYLLEIKSSGQWQTYAFKLGNLINNLSQEVNSYTSCNLLINIFNSFSTPQNWEILSACNGIQNESKLCKELLSVLDTLQGIQREKSQPVDSKEGKKSKKSNSKASKEDKADQDTVMKTEKQPKKKRTLTEAQKKKIAATQQFKCANQTELQGIEGYQCPMWKCGDGSFDESGYEIDHKVELAEGGTDDAINCQALCVCCHKVKTSRYMIARAKK